MPRNATPRRRTTKSNSRNSNSIVNRLLLFFGCCFVAVILAYANREHILRYLGYISDKIHVKPSTAINSNQRTKEVFALFPQSSFGIDVSEYQGRIRWQEVDSAYQKKIDFVVVRATAGTNYTDKKFKRNSVERKNGREWSAGRR